MRGCRSRRFPLSPQAVEAPPEPSEPAPTHGPTRAAALPFAAVDKAPHPGWYKANDGNWYPPLPPSNGHAVGAAVCGAIGLLMATIPILRGFAIPLGAIAMAVGFYARISPVARRLSTTAIILGLIALVLGYTG